MYYIADNGANSPLSAHNKLQRDEMRNTFIYISALALLILSHQTGAAEELETLSAYKVNTYNLGALLEFQESANISLANFEPLMITSSKADILNDQSKSADAMSTTADISSARGFAIAAEYKPTAQLSVQGAFGMATNNWGSLDAAERQSSWEANLGLVYKLLDNLNYEIHFGYMETGDLFKERNSYSDVENIIMVSNKISMSF